MPQILFQKIQGESRVALKTGDLVMPYLIDQELMLTVLSEPTLDLVRKRQRIDTNRNAAATATKLIQVFRVKYPEISFKCVRILLCIIIYNIIP